MLIKSIISLVSKGTPARFFHSNSPSSAFRTKAQVQPRRRWRSLVKIFIAFEVFTIVGSYAVYWKMNHDQAFRKEVKTLFPYALEGKILTLSSTKSNFYFK